MQVASSVYESKRLIMKLKYFFYLTTNTWLALQVELHDEDYKPTK